VSIASPRTIQNGHAAAQALRAYSRLGDGMGAGPAAALPERDEH
jgi:hypothetical protein